VRQLAVGIAKAYVEGETRAAEKTEAVPAAGGATT
jgi:hypothetical protein